MLCIDNYVSTAMYRQLCIDNYVSTTMIDNYDRQLCIDSYVSTTMIDNYTSHHTVLFLCEIDVFLT